MVKGAKIHILFTYTTSTLFYNKKYHIHVKLPLINRCKLFSQENDKPEKKFCKKVPNWKP